jgi:hypothetical protein
MNFKFRNNQFALKKLDSVKTAEVMNSVLKPYNEKMKQQLNASQLQTFVNEVAANCINDVNTKIYESTLQHLVEQYEKDCKPIILNELKHEIYQLNTTKFENELREEIARNCTSKLEEELKQRITERCTQRFENELRQQIVKQYRSIFENELKQQVQREMRVKYEEELKQRIEREIGPKYEHELKQRLENQFKHKREEELKKQFALKRHTATVHSPTDGSGVIPPKTEQVPNFKNKIFDGLIKYKLNTNGLKTSTTDDIHSFQMNHGTVVIPGPIEPNGNPNNHSNVVSRENTSNQNVTHLDEHENDECKLSHDEQRSFQNDKQKKRFYNKQTFYPNHKFAKKHKNQNKMIQSNKHKEKEKQSNNNNHNNNHNNNETQQKFDTDVSI